ncbi:uncharacterized protein sh2d7 [Salvelinus alpinus]
MDQSLPAVESQQDQGTEGSLRTGCRHREMAWKWFMETQAPLILHEGNVPSWFEGFITRRDAEEMLRNKDLGCFLVRLSDKAMGYILSYRGRDRCRHFVINQSKSGQFIVSGDTEEHETLGELIEHYKTSPIEPFREYLTCSCLESSRGEVYDIIKVNLREKPGVSVRAVRSLWDAQSDQQGDWTRASPSDHAGEHAPPPTLPPKSSRKPEEVPTVPRVPPVPRRAGPLKSSSLDDHQGSAQRRVLYAQLEKHKAMNPQPRSLEGLPRAPEGRAEGLGPVAQHQTPPQRGGIPSGRPGAPGPDTVYSELFSLQDCKSKSLPLLDLDPDSEEGANNSYRLSAPSFTPPSLSPNPTKRTTSPSLLDQSYPSGPSLLDQSYPSGPSLLDQSYPSGPSLLDQRYHKDTSKRPPIISHSLEHLCNNPIPALVYQLAGRPRDQEGPMASFMTSSMTSSPQEEEEVANSLYAEVPCEPVLHLLMDDTYEHIPEFGLKGPARPYEHIPELGLKGSARPYEHIPELGLKGSDRPYEHIPELGLTGSARPSANNHTYESVGELKSKHTTSSWGIKVGTTSRHVHGNGSDSHTLLDLIRM